MKKSDQIIAVFAMFFIIIAILISSFQIVMYGDPEYKFYEELYEKYEVLDDLDMTMDDVMEVTDHMMAYLIGDEEELSIVINVDGKEQDFFNEQDRLHMWDVQNLMLNGLKVRTILLVASAVLLILLAVRKAEFKKIIPRAYAIAFGIFMAIAVFFGIAFTVDFHACFWIFHGIFFTNDLWIFDPATDYMIRMLPEPFFSSMVVRIGVTFIGILFAIFAVMYAFRYFNKKRNKENL